MKEREELLWRDEQLRNADRDIDEKHRKYIEGGERKTTNHAGKLAFKDDHLERAGQRLDVLMEFLLCPAVDLSDEELEFRNELLEERGKAAHYLASLLRIHRPGVYYDRFVYYLREQHVIEKWEGSSIKKSREQKTPKGGSTGKRRKKNT